MESYELLKSLSEAHGPSGFEDEVRSILKPLLTPIVDEMKTDALGNLIVRRRADSPKAPVLLVDAHMDEVGFVVSHIEPNGFLRLAPVGGWDERVLPGQRLEVRTRSAEKFVGVIGTTPPHIQASDDKRAGVSLDALFLDLGARDSDEIKSWGVRLGDSVVPCQGFLELRPGIVTGKAFDDRVGCALLVELLHELAQQPRLPFDVVGVFSTFEEMNARGAMVAAYGVAPAMALVLEATVAADVPNVPEARCPTRLGAGPAITLMDKSTHCHPRLVRALEELAEKKGIPYQIKRPIFGGTNAARIHTSRGGVPSAIVSVPCRYIHAPSSVMRLDDYAATRQLIVEFTLEAATLLAS